MAETNIIRSGPITKSKLQRLLRKRKLDFDISSLDDKIEGYIIDLSDPSEPRLQIIHSSPSGNAG